MTSAPFRSAPTEAPAAASILIVDDSPNQLLAMEALLVPLGQRVVTASSGAEALRLLLELDFALVLLDVHLQDIDGFEVARFMRERERTGRTPIIFLSGLTADAGFTERGYALGAVDFLFKPFEPRVLRAKAEVFVELYLHRERLKVQAERQRAESERLRLLNLLTQTPAAIAITRGPDFIFEFANPLYEKVAGRPIPLGRPVREVLPELVSQPQVMEALRHALRTGEPFVAQELQVMLDRKGHGVLEESYFDLVYQPLRDEEGQVQWLLTHAVEVTQQVFSRRQLEATQLTLRRREAELRSLAEHIPNLVARFDREHRYLYVNRIIETPTGVPASRFLGHTNAELGLPEQIVRVWDQAISEAFRSHDVSIDFDYPMPSGTRTFRAHLVAEPDERGEVHSVLTVTHDVTEARQRERALRESEGRLRLMAEAGERLSSLDERALPQRLVELVVPRLADQALVELLSERGVLERIARVGGEGVPPALPEEIRRVLDTGEPLLRAPTAEGQTASEQAVLALPLESHDRLLGVLTLARSGRRFEPEDVVLAQELARRAGLALDNARLYHVASRRAEHLRLLADAFQAFTEFKGEMGPSLRAVVGLVSRSFGDACSLVLHDRKTGALDMAAAHHPDPMALTLMRQAVGRLHQDGLLAHVLRTGEPVRLGSVSQHELSQLVTDAARPFIERMGIHSILVVPLRAPEGVIGTLGLSRERPDAPYSLEDQNLLQELADRAGLVVSNARLLERLKAEH